MQPERRTYSGGSIGCIGLFDRKPSRQFIEIGYMSDGNEYHLEPATVNVDDDDDDDESDDGIVQETIKSLPTSSN